MDLKRLEVRIMKAEGFRAAPYLDTKGVATIGYGSTSWMGRPVTMHLIHVAPEVARIQLRADLFQAVIDARALFTTFDEMNSARQEVLVEMAYNLGKTRLAGFHDLISCADSLDYEGMAAEMKDSKWYREDVGKSRSEPMIEAMALGYWTA